MLSVLALAGNATVPVCVQLDHGATLEQVVGAIRLGFTAVMIDGSLLDYAENVALTRKVVEFAHAVGVSVEAEIGTIGERDPSLGGSPSRRSSTPSRPRPCSSARTPGSTTWRWPSAPATGFTRRGWPRT